MLVGATTARRSRWRFVRPRAIIWRAALLSERRSDIDMAWSLLIVEPQPIFREGLRAILSREPDFNLVGEASNAAEAFDLAAKLEPHIITTEVSLAGQSGLTVARELLRRRPSTNILVLTSH